MINTFTVTASDQFILKESKGDLPALELYELIEGDLIFQNGHCGALCEAINTVTPAIYGRHFSHIGIITTDAQGAWMVIEATYPEVIEIPLEDFLNKSKESHWVGRLSEEYETLHEASIAFARQQIGMPYNLDYIMNNNAFYCSELVYEAYRFANNGMEVFPLYPMTFKAPGTDEFFSNWVAFYKDRGIEIPEGALGCNPGGLANFEDLTIFELKEIDE